MATPLALTLGEPAGIGPDIAIKAWLRRREMKLPPFYLLGDGEFVAARARALGIDLKLVETDPKHASAAFADALPVVATGQKATARPGKPDASSAAATLTSIRQAVGDVAARRAAAVVTNPIAKSVLYRAGFRHPGHTEFLAELAASNGRAPQPVMMLWSPALAVVPVTIHLALRDAIARLSTDLIVSTARIVASGLKSRFGITHPRLALSGLNPHAGEDGTLGTEDSTIVAPAVESLRADGIDVRGPLAADTMFHEVAHGLGIKHVLDKSGLAGKGTVDEALKEYSSSFEEGKADILGLYMIDALSNKGEMDKAKIMDSYVTFLAGILRSHPGYVAGFRRAFRRDCASVWTRA